MSQESPKEEPEQSTVGRIYGPSQRARLDQQIEIIRKAFELDKHVVNIGYDEKIEPHLQAADGPQYLYVEGRILIRDQDLPRLQALRNLETPITGRVIDSLINGVTVWQPDDPNTLGVLAQLDRELGMGVAAPDHVLFVTRGNAGCCPATEPETVGVRTRPFPGVSRDLADGSGVLVSVVDTGWCPDAANNPRTTWLRGVTSELKDEEKFTDGVIPTYAGHGTFVAGIVRCMAPKADVRVQGFLTRGGAILESEIIKQLDDALDDSPDIISLSAGTRSRRNIGLLAFEAFWENRLRHYKGTVLVAAAGNDGNRGPFWPAVFPWAVSVRAVDKKGDRALFSNFGSWVELYAPGVDIVNAFPIGQYTCTEEPHTNEKRDFTTGMARWSGTSFSPRSFPV